MNIIIGGKKKNEREKYINYARYLSFVVLVLNAFVCGGGVYVCVLETAAAAHILTSVEIESITFSSVGLRRKFSFHLLLLLLVMIMYCVIISFRLVLFYLFFVFLREADRLVRKRCPLILHSPS